MGVRPLTLSVMGWSYRIIAPSEAAPLQADAGAYVPRTPLGPFAVIVARLKAHAVDWRQLGRGPDEFAATFADGGGYAYIHLFTPQWYEVFREAQRAETPDAVPYDTLRRALSAYVPRDDEGVTEVVVTGQEYCDIALVARCVAAGPAGAIIFDCQRDEMVTPEEWRRCDRPAR